uniref:SH3 domain-containing protein 19 n=1 Tax=Euleptes europaea TaxID=460621 RepID=UPI00253FC2E7|nr:SH3 domain-containing protein 19 [Euleptes europaea]
MAEAWRLEEDEEERRELARRHRRGNLSPANDRTERNKPDHRSSGQGPLSSIKAVIKRTSRTSGHSEQQRERRRPEITIVAAEPIRPSTWFPGGNHVSRQGLVFPSPPSPGSWRTNALAPAEPPSYEQVIKEIGQVQVGTTSHNNAAGTANSRCTATSSTQTDFPEEIISSSPVINVKSNLHALCECETTPAVQIPHRPPRPLSSLLNNNPSKNEDLVVLEEQTCQEKPDAVTCPVPKPRSKGNLKPVGKETQNNTEDNQEETSQSRETSSIQLVTLLDDNLLDSHVVMNGMDTDKSQSSMVSRIKAFETQANTETSGLAKKPEISPRLLAPKPTVSVKKPVVASKPEAIRTSGEWDSWTESKFKLASQERHLQPQEAGSNITTKPELPKKPKPDTVKSSNNGPLNPGSRWTSENTEGQKKSPVPTPRPLVPKKSVSFESPAVPLLPLQPSSSAPKLSVAAQSNAFRSLGEPTASSLSAPPRQSTSSREGDLISFEDVLPFNSAGAVQELTHSEADFVNLLSKNEPAKEQVIQPAVVRKPTVIRIPSKAAKALNEASECPPPLPIEKPIGNILSISTGKPNNVKTTKKESECSSLTQSSKNEPTMPPRPVEGKIIPARPPAPKGAPGRPPPPKSTKTSSQTDNFCRSSSDTTLHKKHSMFGLGVKRAKSQISKNQDPVLPPRPKPGHPLYNKYMLPVPHGIAKEDISSQTTGSFSCKESNKTQNVSDTSAPHAIVRHDFLAEHPEDLGLNSGETVYLLKKIDDEWYRGKCKNRTGIFPASFVKVIVDIPEESNRKKVPFSSPSVTGPRCIARFEYIGDQNDELSFSEGEIIILKEYVNEEWAKGELRGASGIFPLNFVEVLEDLPAPDAGAALKNKKENCASVTQLEQHSGEWCDALHDFIAETNEDLSFKKGDRILILERVDSEWYRGRLNGKEGIFPAIFVLICSEGPKPPPGKRRGQALYDFCAENVDELSFKAGDMITELESVDEDWMSGELRDKSGIFPKNFVQIFQ